VTGAGEAWGHIQRDKKEERNNDGRSCKPHRNDDGRYT
jgi:hypothetical protein